LIALSLHRGKSFLNALAHGTSWHDAVHGSLADPRFTKLGGSFLLETSSYPWYHHSWLAQTPWLVGEIVIYNLILDNMQQIPTNYILIFAHE
jgi:hypothetical protein